MVLETLAATAAGYILTALVKSEGAKTAGKELSTALWQWVRPLLLEDVPETVAKVEQAAEGTAPGLPVGEATRGVSTVPTAADAETALAAALQARATADPNFAAALRSHVEKIQTESQFTTYVQGDHNKVLNLGNNNGTIQF